MKNFSVIIPVYNPEQFIDSIISSLKYNLDYIGEIILVNNGKTEQFDKLIDSLNNGDIHNLKIIQAEYKCGPGLARDLGVENAKYKYMAFFDCDDIWNDNHLKNSLELLENDENVQMTYCDYSTINGNHEILTLFELPEYTTYKELILTNYFAMPSIIVKSQIAKKYKFGNRGHEDFHFLISVLKNENIIARKVDNTPMKILRGHESVSSNKFNAVKWHYQRLIEFKIPKYKIPYYIFIYTINAILKRKLKVYKPIGI